MTDYKTTRDQTIADAINARMAQPAAQDRDEELYLVFKAIYDAGYQNGITKIVEEIND